MARIKVRLVINKGRHGAPMAKLGRISEQAEKFLRFPYDPYGRGTARSDEIVEA